MPDDSEIVVIHVLKHRTDYYALFNIKRDANADDIKRAYKRLALRLHPDKNKHERAEECFKIVGTANGVLTDPAKRSAYDRGGEAAVQQQEQRGGGGAGFPGGGHAFYRQQHNPFGGAQFHFQQFGGGGGDDVFDDIFSMFMGADPRMMHRRQQQQQQYRQQQQQQRQQQQHHYQQQQRGSSHNAQPYGRGGNDTGFVGMNLLGMLPLLLMLFLALALSGGAFTNDSTGASSRGAPSSASAPASFSSNVFGRSTHRRSLFSLSADPQGGLNVERVTTQLSDDWMTRMSSDGRAAGELRIPYFVSRDFELEMRRNRMTLVSVETEVARATKDSLSRRCHADAEVARVRNRPLKSKACRDLETYQKLFV